VVDSYNRVLDGQFFVLDEPAARYSLGITSTGDCESGLCVGDGDAARRATRTASALFAESDYSNNTGSGDHDSGGRAESVWSRIDRCALAAESRRS